MSGLTLTRRLAIYERDNFTCQGCGLHVPRERVLAIIEQARRDQGRFPRGELLTLDHIIPRVAGGSNSDRNLQTLCAPCNQKKGAAVPEGVKAAARKGAAHLRRKHRVDKPRLIRGGNQLLGDVRSRARISGARHMPGCDPVFGCVGSCPVPWAGYPIVG